MAEMTMPNPRTALDAAVAFCLYPEARSRRASEPGSSAVPDALQDSQNEN
jgi:hypothetical protein